MLIGMSMNMGNKEKTRAAALQALSISPASFTIREVYLNSLLPKWGGSPQAVVEFAKESQTYTKENPKLKWLLGSLYTAAANRQRSAKNYDIAEDLYKNALKFGENHSVFFEQSKSFYWKKDYTQALTSINQALNLYIEDYNYYYWRSKIFTKQNKYAKAATDILFAERLNPYNTLVQKRKKRLANKLVRKAYDLGEEGKVSKQIEYCSLALLLEPNNVSAYSRRARGYTRQNKLNLAVQDAKKAIQLQPKNVVAYDLIDYILAFEEDWDTIIKYWTQYIQLNPNDGHAYIERGGAYYRKGDKKSAFADAKISARLGNPMGKKMYNKLRHKME
jgi:tetratricopeptide (TPR) repeat protein